MSPNRWARDARRYQNEFKQSASQRAGTRRGLARHPASLARLAQAGPIATSEGCRSCRSPEGR
jgi:hypothetical protein